MRPQAVFLSARLLEGCKGGGCLINVMIEPPLSDSFLNCVLRHFEALGFWMAVGAQGRCGGSLQVSGGCPLEPQGFAHQASGLPGEREICVLVSMMFREIRDGCSDSQHSL